MMWENKGLSFREVSTLFFLDVFMEEDEDFLECKKNEAAEATTQTVAGCNGGTS